MKRILKWIIPGPKRLIIFFFLIIGLQYITSSFSINMWLDNLQVRETVMVKGNSKIILLPMSHIGEKDFYQEIKTRYKKNKDMIVLLEGVKMNPEDEKIDHSSLATMLGLEMQSKNLFEEYNTVNADVSSEDFSEETSKFITIVMNYYANLKEKGIAYASKKFEEEQIEMGITGVDQEQIKNDIVVKRNKQLFSKIKEYKNKYDVVLVPWGALHIPGIQEDLQNIGYVESSHSQIKVMNWVSAVYSFISFQINN